MCFKTKRMNKMIVNKKRVGEYQLRIAKKKEQTALNKPPHFVSKQIYCYTFINECLLKNLPF